ncbi:MAG TPA: hypothetical protein DCY93_00920 [Firmicutes bacterium]|nr:hypothetical protein [Bacillota bacterium]
MSGKTRVEEYKKLREEIENIDMYSFDDPKKMPPVTKKEVLLPVHNIDDYDDDFPVSVDEKMESDHIKKNTLSMTIDEIIQQHNAYKDKVQKKELDEKVKEKNAKNKKTFDLKTILWIVIGAIVVVFIVIIGLVMGGVL